ISSILTVTRYQFFVLFWTVTTAPLENFFNTFPLRFRLSYTLVGFFMACRVTFGAVIATSFVCTYPVTFFPFIFVVTLNQFLLLYVFVIIALFLYVFKTLLFLLFDLYNFVSFVNAYPVIIGCSIVTSFAFI